DDEDNEDTPEGAETGITNDPSNSCRALLLLQDAGLIAADADKQENPTPVDIVANQRDVECQELDAAQIPGLLDEVDLAVINGNFATSNDLDPTTDSIFTESTDSPYVNVLGVRDENKDDPVIEQIKEDYYTDEVEDYLLEEYNGAYQPAW